MAIIVFGMRLSIYRLRPTWVLCFITFWGAFSSRLGNTGYVYLLHRAKPSKHPLPGSIRSRQTASPDAKPNTVKEFITPPWTRFVRFSAMLTLDTYYGWGLPMLRHVCLLNVVCRKLNAGGRWVAGLADHWRTMRRRFDPELTSSFGYPSWANFEKWNARCWFCAGFCCCVNMYNNEMYWKGYCGGAIEFIWWITFYGVFYVENKWVA